VRETDVTNVNGAAKEIEDAFDASSSYWRNIYSGSDLHATVYRERHAAALAWIDELRLPAGSPVLEVGCGAGFLTVALASRGYRVESIDSSDAMVESTRARIGETGFDGTAAVRAGDVQSLSARDGSYAAVIALGVVPWLHSPQRALREIARVLRPGGATIVTVDNRARLNFVLDPRYNPLLLYPVKRRLKRVLQRFGRRSLGVLPDVHYPAELDRLVRAVGLEKQRSRTVGFGPFTFLGLRLFSDAGNVRLHHRLQRLADRGVPIVRSAGMNYMVLATKPHPSP
jgi:2-polyprenyl-3-methyl-5-hydroxy-6-metoxy-1,4-benzoquinol methylase